MLFKSLFLATVVSGASWTYSDQAAWTGQCQTSKSQSPINIISSSAVSKNSKDDPIKADSFVAEKLGGKHAMTLNNVTSSGTHSATWTFKTMPENSQLKCAQYHCHFDVAEHSMDGDKHFGECHVVCMQAKYADLGKALESEATDALAVFGFLLAKGTATTVDHAVTKQMIDAKKNYAEGKEYEMEIPATTQLADGYYRYNGGLTTPGCNEAVTWTVFKNVQYVSVAQYDEIMTWKDGNLRGNDRKVQPMNGRSLTFYKSSASKMMASLAIIGVMFMF